MIYFLIPAYNEEKSLSKVIYNIRKHFKENYKIIVINDGSTDNTAKELSKLVSTDLSVINHKTNLGLGSAIKTGLIYILPTLTSEDAVITMDADNTHPVEISYLMIEKFNQGCDLIIASRYIKDARQYGVSFFRKLLSFSAKLILQKFFPYCNIKDYTSGYRLYSGGLLKKMFEYYKEYIITQNNFVVQLELLVKSFRFKPKVCEVPLKLEYYRKYGKSKLKIIKNIISYVKLIIKLKIRKDL